MEDLFIHVLNISITASFLVLAIILYRLFAKKAPKWVSVLLWGLVGLRLLFPFSIESALSLIPSKNTIPQRGEGSSYRSCRCWCSWYRA